jgi:hypothetical protein
MVPSTGKVGRAAKANLRWGEAEGYALTAHWVKAGRRDASSFVILSAAKDLHIRGGDSSLRSERRIAQSGLAEVVGFVARLPLDVAADTGHLILTRFLVG